MCRKTLIVLTTVLLLIIVSSIAVAGNTIRIIVNGKQIYSDVPPFIQNGRTMVPIRFVSEALRANVRWDEATQTVFVTTNPALKTLFKAREYWTVTEWATDEMMKANNYIKNAFIDIQNPESWLTKAEDSLNIVSSYEEVLYSTKTEIANSLLSINPGWKDYAQSLDIGYITVNNLRISCQNTINSLRGQLPATSSNYNYIVQVTDNIKANAEILNQFSDVLKEQIMWAVNAIELNL